MHRKASWVTSCTGTWRAPSFEPSRMFDENITRNASDRACRQRGGVRGCAVACGMVWW